jgi:rRNA maturation RNase YbeY
MAVIRFFFEDTDVFRLERRRIKDFMISLISKENKIAGEINVIFCSDPYLLKMNKQYLKHNYFTDIITFESNENEIISGDLFISIDRIKENAVRYKTDFKNELLRVIFHGVLHLVGYKDKSISEKKLMKEKENLYLCDYALNC